MLYSQNTEQCLAHNEHYMLNASILAITITSITIGFNSQTKVKQLKAYMGMNYTRKPKNWSTMRKKSSHKKNISLDSKSILEKARTIMLMTEY